MIANASPTVKHSHSQAYTALPCKNDAPSQPSDAVVVFDLICVLASDHVGAVAKCDVEFEHA